MSPENFAYWIQGWFEIGKIIERGDGASLDELQEIKNHLDLVFKKVTPDRKYCAQKGETYKPLMVEPNLLCENRGEPLWPGEC